MKKKLTSQKWSLIVHRYGKETNFAKLIIATACNDWNYTQVPKTKAYFTKLIIATACNDWNYTQVPKTKAYFTKLIIATAFNDWNYTQVPKTKAYFTKLISGNRDNESLRRALTEITHKSRSKAKTGNIKCSLKAAKVFPSYKIKDLTDPNTFRPISLVSILSEP